MGLITEVKPLLEKKSLAFKESGRDFVIKCLNPDHDDKNPSMRIDKISGVFRCPSCGFKGNIFSYYKIDVNPVSKKRTILLDKINRKRAETLGIFIPKEAVPFERDYRNIKAKTYKDFGAFEHHAPEFIGRVVFPLYTFSGRLQAFIGRHMSDENPKYRVFPSGTALPMFPRSLPYNGSMIIVEGIFDVLNLYDKGLTNVVCGFGVNTIDKNKLSILKVQGVKSIEIIFDGDEAGSKGAKELKDLAESMDMQAQIIVLKPGEDPGSFTQAKVDRLKTFLYG